MAVIHGTPNHDEDSFQTTGGVPFFQWFSKLRGTEENDQIYGYGGNDVLFGNGGDDLLDGGTGNDWMEGGTGSDTYYVDSLGDTVIEGLSSGFDTVIASVNGYTLSANVERLTLAGTTYSGYGNESNNLLIGNHSDNFLRGWDGNDYLYGGDGNDTLLGDDGADYLYGDAGADDLFGGAGADFLSGGSGDDFMVGGDGHDRLLGGSNNDILVGDSGNDTLQGSDAWWANAGEFDTLTGGTGADRFVLGTAFDKFYQGVGQATITDFSWVEGDKIQVMGSTSNYTLAQSWSGGQWSTTISQGGDTLAVVNNMYLIQSDLVSA
jgi:serralysin